MKHYIVLVVFMTLMSGRIKLNKDQYSRRAFALLKTDEPDVYEITGKIGFKKGEEFSYDGDLTRLVKSGQIGSLDDRDDQDVDDPNNQDDQDDQDPVDEEMVSILKELGSKSNSELKKMAKSYNIEYQKFERVEVLKQIAGVLYSHRKYEDLVKSLESLSEDELVVKAGEVGVLPGDMSKDDLILAIADKIVSEESSEESGK